MMGPRKSVEVLMLSEQLQIVENAWNFYIYVSGIGMAAYYGQQLFRGWGCQLRVKCDEELIRRIVKGMKRNFDYNLRNHLPEELWDGVQFYKEVGLQ